MFSGGGQRRWPLAEAVLLVGGVQGAHLHTRGEGGQGVRDGGLQLFAGAHQANSREQVRLPQPADDTRLRGVDCSRHNTKTPNRIRLVQVARRINRPLTTTTSSHRS
eukprot:1194989-Prorocentrum_minimum.AAC.1